MRFEGLELPKCNYWLERMNVLFLIDSKNKDIPFISSSMAPDADHQLNEHYPIQVVRNMIYPEDVETFDRLINWNKKVPFEQERNLRIQNGYNNPVWFHMSKITTGEENKNMYFIALPG